MKTAANEGGISEGNVSFETTYPEPERFFGRKEVLYLFPEIYLNFFSIIFSKT
jgi:hypothetical protein